METDTLRSTHVLDETRQRQRAQDRCRTPGTWRSLQLRGLPFLGSSVTVDDASEKVLVASPAKLEWRRVCPCGRPLNGGLCARAANDSSYHNLPERAAVWKGSGMLFLASAHWRCRCVHVPWFQEGTLRRERSCRLVLPHLRPLPVSHDSGQVRLLLGFKRLLVGACNSGAKTAPREGAFVPVVQRDALPLPCLRCLLKEDEHASCMHQMKGSCSRIVHRIRFSVATAAPNGSFTASHGRAFPSALAERP